MFLITTSLTLSMEKKSREEGKNRKRKNEGKVSLPSSHFESITRMNRCNLCHSFPSNSSILFFLLSICSSSSSIQIKGNERYHTLRILLLFISLIIIHPLRHNSSHTDTAVDELIILMNVITIKTIFSPFFPTPRIVRLEDAQERFALLSFLLQLVLAANELILSSQFPLFFFSANRSTLFVCITFNHTSYLLTNTILSDSRPLFRNREHEVFLVYLPLELKLDVHYFLSQS